MQIYIADSNIANVHFHSFTFVLFVGCVCRKYFQDYFICFEMQVCVFHNFLNLIVENRIITNKFNEKIQ